MIEVAGNTKSFSTVAFLRNDRKSKQLIIEVFQNRCGITLIENPDRYGIDLLGKNYDLRVEVEHREDHWVRGEFPFDEVNIFARRVKYLTGDNSIYIVISKDWSTIGLLPPENAKKYITDKHLEDVQNKKKVKGEKAYKVPQSAFYWIDIINWKFYANT